MAIVDGKVAALGPVCHVFPIRRFRHVQNNGDTILIIVPLDALVSIGSIRSDQAMGLRRELGRLKVHQRVCNNFGHLEVDVEHF